MIPTFLLATATRFSRFLRHATSSRALAPSESAARLEAGLRELDLAADEVERSFTGLGESFKQQALLTSHMFSEAEQLNSSGVDSEDEPLRRAFALVQDSLAFVERYESENRRVIECFDRYQSQFEIVRKGEAHLARTLVPLQIIERLFRIEAASLPTDSQSAFESLTKEIAVLHREMRDTLEHEFSTLRITGSSIAQIRDQLAEHAVQLRQRSERNREGIRAALENLERRLAQDSQRNHRLDEATREIARESDTVMVGLQYQDFMSQRSQHVTLAVGDIIGKLRQLRGGRRGKAARSAHALCLLEAKQLEAISRDLRKASRDVERGVRSFYTHIDALQKSCLPPAELDASVSSAEAALASMLAALRESRELVALAKHGADRAFAAVESFGGEATHVTANLRELASSIKLIALNAQVQAAKMGDGTGLEVLSGRTCDLSDETHRFTEQIGGRLDELTQLLNSAVDACSLTKSEADQMLQNLDTDQTQLESQLVQHKNDSIGRLKRLSELLTQCRSNASGMLEKASFGDEPSRALESLRSALEEARPADATKTADSTRFKFSEETLSRLAASYTMDSERAIHDDLFGGADPFSPDSNRSIPPRAASRLTPEPVAASGGPDDNVELF